LSKDESKKKCCYAEMQTNSTNIKTRNWTTRIPLKFVGIFTCS